MTFSNGFLEASGLYAYWTSLLRDKLTSLCCSLHLLANVEDIVQTIDASRW